MDRFRREGKALLDNKPRVDGGLALAPCYDGGLRDEDRWTVQPFSVDLSAIPSQQERDAARQALQDRADELERLMFGLITALEQANTLNDDDTGNHIRRVAELSGLLAEDMGCPPAFCSALRRYAGLHDVGGTLRGPTLVVV